MRFKLILLLALLGACSQDQAPIVTYMPQIAAAGSAEPNLSVGQDGTVVLSWLEPSTDGVALRYSVLEGDDWLPPVDVASGNDWFVNWADFPSVVKIDESLWAAHWLAKRPGGTFAYDVAVSLSRDGGSTWSDPVTPHTDGTATEHGFVSLFPWQDGVGALWLDGRNMSGHGKGGMTLRSAVLSAVGDLSFEQLADELVCDCCQTDVAAGPDGPIAVYRDRSEAEIRDIFVMRAGGDGWMPGRAIADDAWEIAGCPVNGPSIASVGNQVAVAWFTASRDVPRVRFARSADGAKTFGDAVEIASGRVAGRVGVTLLGDGSAAVSWLRPATDGNAEILLTRVTANGIVGDNVVVATTESGRVSGFPQLARTGNHLVMAWTDTLGDRSLVRSALIVTD